MIGIFAGRGDVIIAIGFALLFGNMMGWWLRGKRDQLRVWWLSRVRGH